jgi:ATP-dependent DNA helicase Rep
MMSKGRLNLDQLNREQREAVLYNDGPLLVLAGAGSGKTRVITHKIAHLVQEKGVAARHIAAVTFTNKAAREMAERARGLLNEREGYGLKVSTFHTLGLSILRREHTLLGLRSGFSIYDSSDCSLLLRELLQREGIEQESLSQPLSAMISRWKNDQIKPERAISEAMDESEALAARLYADYNRHLRLYNAVDFDDLILLPVDLFGQHPDRLEQWQNRIRYLLVDEYQDTNATQYALLRQLIGLRHGLTVVGDDDQSIYAWRGARPENLRHLRDDYPNLRLVKLEQNYRSTGNILRTANQLIANNPHLFEKRLWSQLGPGDPLRVLCCSDAEAETERVASEIQAHQFRTRSRFSDYAVLFRSNHQARNLERTLRSQRIPYHLSGGSSFFERSEIKDLIAYLRLLVNPEDDGALLRIINTPRREIGATTIERLNELAQEQRLPVSRTLYLPECSERLPARGATSVRQLAQWLDRLRQRQHIIPASQLLQEMVDQMGYPGWIEESSANPGAAARRLESVEELIGWLAKMEQSDDQELHTLPGMVSRMTLLGILDRQEEDEEQDAVHLMTLHAAKGLEFDHVFLCGTEEQLLPHHASIEAGTLEEERRLAYVGITRARRTLTFTLARRRRRGGELVECEPSRFLTELPQELLEWEGAGIELPEAVRRERGRRRLEDLKAMFGEG